MMKPGLHHFFYKQEKHREVTFFIVFKNIDKNVEGGNAYNESIKFLMKEGVWDL